MIRSHGLRKTFEPNADIAPGVKALAAGHTPGHSSYVFESGGQKLIVLGDVIHVGAVQFPDPDVAIAFDTDNKAAIKGANASWTMLLAGLDQLLTRID